jgi:hypothetical protein
LNSTAERKRGREFGVDDGIDRGFTGIDERFQLLARPCKPARVFCRDVEEDVGINMRSILAARHGHDSIGGEPGGRTALGVLEPALKSHLLFAFCRADDDRIALREKFHVGSGQEMEALADFLRNGDLAFGRDLHAVKDARELRFPQVAKEAAPVSRGGFRDRLRRAI